MSKTPEPIVAVDGATEAGVIADLATAAERKPFVIPGPEGRRFLVLPEGWESQEVLDDPDGLTAAAPIAIAQSVLLQTQDSLVDYLLRFKTSETVLFADMAANRILAVVDYHGASAADEPGDAARLLHTVSLDLPFSEEWKTWTAADDKRSPQLEFARFLEENAPDISAPSAADILEACRDLQAVRNVDFRAAVRTNQDNESFEYADNTEARIGGGKLELPTRFTLRVPVYFGGRTVEIDAFLRWALDDGKLKLGVKLHRAEHVRQSIFREIVGQVSSLANGVPAVFGKPSSGSSLNPAPTIPRYLRRVRGGHD